MRRDERKSTGARGVSNYRQETNMTRQPSKTNNDEPTEGWRAEDRRNRPNSNRAIGNDSCFLTLISDTFTENP
jgi:hypothetical protein